MAIMTHYHKAFFLTTIKTSKNIMHEKNLYEEWRLSPAFDLVPLPFYGIFTLD